jgi:hypothetical protein
VTYPLCEQIDYLIYEAIGDEMEPDSSAPDNRVIKEDLIQFLTALGIEEGVDFCVDNEEIFLPPGISVGPPPVPFGKKTFDKWPDYVFTYTDAEPNLIMGRGKGIEAEIPTKVFPLIEYHSAKIK